MIEWWQIQKTIQRLKKTARVYDISHTLFRHDCSRWNDLWAQRDHSPVQMHRKIHMFKPMFTICGSKRVDLRSTGFVTPRIQHLFSQTKYKLLYIFTVLQVYALIRYF
jgi:hypothetical protein